MIYFIAAPSVGKIKIGRAGAPWDRLGKLRPFSPVKLVLLASVKGPASLEGRFHTYFLPYHSHHEWFHDAPPLKEAIAQILAGEFDFTKLPAKGRKAWAWKRRAESEMAPNGKPYAVRA